mmetsp:Transcript_34581/g.83428  ORF Transcript_34581/g.83428 Transcript_34581/m.83428 type:complete len:207 (+) Transcript_34581:571-1191(+)
MRHLTPGSLERELQPFTFVVAFTQRPFQRSLPVQLSCRRIVYFLQDRIGHLLPAVPLLGQPHELLRRNTHLQLIRWTNCALGDIVREIAPGIHKSDCVATACTERQSRRISGTHAGSKAHRTCELQLLAHGGQRPRQIFDLCLSDIRSLCSLGSLASRCRMVSSCSFTVPNDFFCQRKNPFLQLSAFGSLLRRGCGQRLGAAKYNW